MIDLDRKYKTRDGREVVKLFAVNNPKYPIVGIVRSTSGTETPFSYTAEGRFVSYKVKGDPDLIPVIQERTVYFNVYGPETDQQTVGLGIFRTIEAAIEGRKSSGIRSTIKLDIEDGKVVRATVLDI